MEDYNQQQPYNNQGYGNQNYGNQNYGNQNYGGPNYDYNNNYDPGYDGGGPNKSVKGLKIMIIIMAVILVALSAIYFMQVKQMQEDFAIERDTLTSQLTSLLNDYDTLKTLNDTLSVHYEGERQKADSLLQTLQKERRLSYAKIREYEKKMTYMREVMTGYIRQIDSLNTLNKNLIKENVSYRKEISSANLRAEVAEEKASELSTKVRQGAVIRARGIRLVPLNARDKEVSRVKNASRLRVEFTLAGNDLAEPGERTVYVRITSPDGYVQSNASAATFEFEGERLTYTASRDVDYQNEDLAVGVYYNDGAGFTAGTYRVEVYADGRLAGQSDIVLR